MTGSEAAPDAFLERSHVNFYDFAHVADVDFFTGIMWVIEQKFFALKNVRPGKSHGVAAEGIDGFDDFRINFAGQNIVHDFGRGLVSHALALDEIGLQSRAFHGTGDRLAAAMDDDGVNFNSLEKHHVPCDTHAGVFIGRVHEAAAVFDHESGPAEFLDIRERFEQRVGFGN